MSRPPRWRALLEEAREAKRSARAEMSRAVTLAEEALREARAAGPETERHLAELMNYLASLYRETGRMDEAIATAREGLACRRAMVPRSAALIGNDVMFLCLALMAKGSFGEALAVSEEGLSLYEEAYGPDHGEVRYVRAIVEELRGRQRR